MTVADTFFKQFEILADAPNAVPKLRELILQLAVRGKLVSQDPNDEPASVLLEKIYLRKEKLAIEKGFKNTKPETNLVFDLYPLELPISWIWTCIGNIALIRGGKRLPNGAYFSVDVTPYIYISVTNMKKGTIVKNNLKYISEETFNSIKNYIIEKEDIYISIAGTIGQVGEVPDDFHRANLTENAARIVFRGLDKRFLVLMLNSDLLQDQFREKTKQQAQPKLALKRIANALFPLPPLNEQKRIVEKVDKLMEWCDRLEKQQQQRRETCINLNRVALTQLTTATTTDEFSDRWQKVRDNFDLLYSLPENVSQLRQTILQLAVMGKLVKQDPNDEPASILLERIKIEKQKLIANKKADKEINTNLEENKLGLTIPSCWQWIKLGEIIISIRYGTSKHCSYESQGHPVLRIPNLVNGNIDIDDLKYTNLTDKECKDLELKESDILIIRSNGSTSLVGRSAIVDSSINGYAYAGYLVRLRFLLDFIFPNYIHLALSTPFVREQIELPIRTTSGVKNINSTEIANLTFPLPSLNEQKRIVAKVEEMMRLCDGLEAKLKEAETNRQKLLESGIRQVLSQI